MNKHLKIAIFVAPFLSLVGYIGFDHYLQSPPEKPQLFILEPRGDCDFLYTACLLKSGELELKIYDSDGLTKVSSNFPLQQITLFLVAEKVLVFDLAAKENGYNFQAETPLRLWSAELKKGLKLRLVAKLNQIQYIAEFSGNTAR